jgi:hypothetical protein
MYQTVTHNADINSFIYNYMFRLLESTSDLI